MEQAIKQAIKGGYTKYAAAQLNSPELTKGQHSIILLDPKFWVALGKAEGWREDLETYGVPKEFWCWQKQFHRFIDHLADGGTPDEFFEKLLTKQN